ncbi:MAG: hypothetical protein QOK39_2632 [Acidimicrobiaceae bacterium]|nr:hypothetical protein [Acidimicrobiaceae bacterium]
MSVVDANQRWPQQTVFRVHNSVLVDTPLMPTWGSRTWAAVMWPDARAAGGWGRAMMPPGPGGRGYAADQMTPGDVVEFGADYQRQMGRKRVETVANRWYGVVLATDPRHVVAFGPFPGPEPARLWAERAMQTWRQSVTIDLPAELSLGQVAPPAPALPAGRDRRSGPAVEVHAAGDVTRVDDARHGRMVVDTAAFGAAMGTDTAELVAVLGDVYARSGQPDLDGSESKATLAALAARHAPERLAVDVADVATAPLPTVPAGGRDAIYYGHPDGSVERVDERGSRPLRPSRRWSPDGFGWGYQGDEPTELADALLSDSTGSRDVARRLASRYGDEVIADLPQGRAWSLPVASVAAWARGVEQQTPVAASSRVSRGPRHDVEAGL